MKEKVTTFQKRDKWERKTEKGERQTRVGEDAKEKQFVGGGWRPGGGTRIEQHTYLTHGDGSFSSVFNDTSGQGVLHKHESNYKAPTPTEGQARIRA